MTGAIGCGRVGFDLLPAPDDHGDHGDSGASNGSDGDGGGSAVDAAVGPGSDAGGVADACVGDDCAGSCASDPSDEDDDCDGVDDDCDGDVDEDFEAHASTCGVGACAASGTVTCVAGKTRDSCEQMDPVAAADDATCDGVDDDCDGEEDEDYASTPTTCGASACASTGAITCVDGTEQDTCTPATPPATVDGPTADGVDDDCDGAIDEDACTAAPQTFSATGLTNITVPANCGTMTVQLWGAGGASGSGNSGYWVDVTGGAGGPGGFAQNTFTVTSSSTIALRIGQGGQGCGNNKGTNDATYDGGNGATTAGGNGSPGADGTESGGGGASPSGGDGGDGCFGGGGGGSGSSPFAPAGPAGAGGAASVLFVDATRLLAGGGGGGGGAGSTIATNGVSGGAGGSGCSGAGAGGSAAQGGGGGGGGKCDGATNSPGAGTNPFVPAGVTLPAGTATGGTTAMDCEAGGTGYARITWAP
jgi:hypothetical protein